MQLTISQLNTTIGNIEENARLIIETITQNKDTDMFVFPECVLSGYMPLDNLYYDSFFDRLQKSLQHIQQSLSDTQYCIIGTLHKEEQKQDALAVQQSMQDTPISSKNNTLQTYESRYYSYISSSNVYNSAIYCCHTQGTIGMQHKRLLPQKDVFFEQRYFQTETKSRLFHHNNTSFAVLICEDLWGPIEAGYPAYDVLQLRPDIIIVISASPYEFDKKNKRMILAKKLVQSIGSPLVFCNMVGANDEIIFDGSSFVLTKEAQLLAQLSHCKEEHMNVYFSHNNKDMSIIPTQNTAHDTISEHDKDANTNAVHSSLTKEQKAFSVQQKELHDHSFYMEHDAPFSISQASFSSYIGEVVEALCMGLSDYLTKSSLSHKVHLGISGGIDSAVVAALACRSVGAHNVCGILLPSQYTSKESWEDAQALIENAGMPHYVLSIKETYATMMDTLAPVFQNTSLDTTEENLQARIRGILLMSYANKHGSSLLTTGNKSELAVGYATLYGDMCGAINIIGDLYKTQIYEMAEYLNRDASIIPQRILEKAPSAELRENQRDDDSLPPYDVLDEILYLFINEYKSLEYVLSLRMYEEESVKKVWKLYQTSEFKRYQAAPILKVSSRAFGKGRFVPLVAQF